MSLKMIWANNASTKLIKLLLPSDKIIYVEDPTRFPKPVFGEEYFMITIEHPITHDFEICKVYKVIDNQFFVERAQEGTNALEFPVGSIVENRITKGTLELLRSSGSGLPSNRKPNQVLKVKKDNSVEFAYGQNIYTFEKDKLQELKDLLYLTINNKFKKYYDQLQNSVSAEEFLDDLDGFLLNYLFTDLDDVIETIFDFDTYSSDSNILFGEENIFQEFSLIDKNNINIFYKNYSFNKDIEELINFDKINNYNKIKNYMGNDIYNLNKNQIKEVIDFIKFLFELHVIIMSCLFFQEKIDEEYYIYNFLTLFTDEISDDWDDGE